jgi:transposase-like protein
LTASRKLVRAGFFKRRSDSKWIQRFKCTSCARFCSTATFHSCFRQKKRTVNRKIFVQLASSNSQRRIAKELRLSRTTVYRKFRFLAENALIKLDQENKKLPKSQIVEFDDLETFEHTICKPLSVTLAVEHKSRRILAFQTSSMPAKGKLASIALKKYGARPDERAQGRMQLFTYLKELVDAEAIFKSDQNPHYPASLKTHFPAATHQAFKGQRGSIVGQGELKRVRFDPLFSLNHTCAMLRANINRLVRKTWCTTKKAENLQKHIAIYAIYHNKELINSS